MKKIAVISDWSGFTSLTGLIHHPNMELIHIENPQMVQGHYFNDWVYVYGTIQDSVEYHTLVNLVKSRII